MLTEPAVPQNRPEPQRGECQVRTDDPLHAMEVLYQTELNPRTLRVDQPGSRTLIPCLQSRCVPITPAALAKRGADPDRTDHLLSASETLFQMSYSPKGRYLDFRILTYSRSWVAMSVTWYLGSPSWT